MFELQNASSWVEDATLQQRLRHTAFRAISGTAGTFVADQMAAMKTELEAHSITVPPDFDSRLIAWLQLRLNSSNSNRHGLLVEWARAEGVDDAGLIGSFDPTPPTIAAVAASADDAEEVVSSGIVSISGTSIELQDDRIAGFRFEGIEIPQGATIAHAWIQFTSAITVASGGTAAAMVDIYGEAADDAAAFTTGTADISGRTPTTATVEWSLPESSGASAWTIGDRSPNQRTPDLATIVQEIVDRAGWASGNAMAFTLQHDGVGLGSRVVVAQDDAGYKEAVLYVAWTVGIVQAGLLAEWRFDDGAGTTLTDYSGNGHHGTFGAGGAAPTWTPAGLSFDGGDYVSVPSVNPSGDEITVWYVAYKNSPAGGGYVIAAGDYLGDGIAYNAGFGQAAGDSFAVLVTDNGTLDPGHHLILDETSINYEDAWHALAFTFDGSTLRLYRNNTLVLTSGATISGLFDITEPVLIGANFVGGPVSGLSGKIAYLTINEGVMTSEQMAAQYRALQVIMAGRGIALP